MKTNAGWAQLAALVALVVVVTPVLGHYLAALFGSDGERAPGDSVLRQHRAVEGVEVTS